MYHFTEQTNKDKCEPRKHGWYSKPRILLWMLTEEVVSKAEYWLLDILLSLENQYGKGPHPKGKRGQWFFYSNKAICSYGLLSMKTLRTARKALVDRGWIEFKSGRTGHASEYKIVKGTELDWD